MDFQVSDEVWARARRVKMFLMDVDGTLTEGGISLMGPPEPVEGTPCQELKTFHAQDGPGLGMAHDAGIVMGFITGRHSAAVAQRARELQVKFVWMGQKTKTAAYEACLLAAGVGDDEVAYLGDDLPDIVLAKRVGLACCVADGADELKAVSHYVCRRDGGRGTAREVVELILRAQGRWDEAVAKAHASGT